MAEHFISLKCPSCGGKLDVSDDMERFTCGYCGTEMQVQRRGGTIALNAITDALQSLQAGAEKAAAELALVRHGRERTDLEDRLNELRRKASRIPEPPPAAAPDSTPWMSIAILTVLVAAGIYLSVTTFGGLRASGGLGVLSILCSVLAFAIRRGERKRRELRDTWKKAKQELEMAIDEVKRDIAGHEREIARQRSIVSVPGLAPVLNR